MPSSRVQRASHDPRTGSCTCPRSVTARHLQLLSYLGEILLCGHSMENLDKAIAADSRFPRTLVPNMSNA